MCGVTAMAGPGVTERDVAAMTARLRHRGPDDEGFYADPAGGLVLGHRRLAILDLSPAGRQPMADPTGRFWLTYNGEIYNYRELRHELGGDAAFRTGTDTEVLLAAWARWGPACLDRLLGMFAFVLWDGLERRLWAVRDRFGVKPLYWHRRADGTLLLASEIKALHAAGVAREPDPAAWASYLVHGHHDDGRGTFWSGVEAVPAGCRLSWQGGEARVERWYDPVAGADDEDRRPHEIVREEATALFTESVRLRFRSDVPVGVNLSGGLDSSLLLGLVEEVFGPDNGVRGFTFTTGDPAYDELPWVERMVETTRHPLTVCPLSAGEVPALAASVAEAQDEPFGGLPTLAYAKLFERARAEGVVVLLDGQGVDEAWAGYDYHLSLDETWPRIQGSRESPVRPECLAPELVALAPSRPPLPQSVDPLRRRQLRDLLSTKLPRALRFNDRASMRASCELREPFLDHRLVELGLRQPAARKAAEGVGKRLPREIARRLLPGPIVETPKRPVQTPQREWLRGPLAAWADDLLERALHGPAAAWLDAAAVRREWQHFRRGSGDNSYFLWQWLSLGMLAPEPHLEEALR